MHSSDQLARVEAVAREGEGTRRLCVSIALDPGSATPMPSRVRLHQLVSVPEGEEDVGYESKAVDSPAGHDVPRFALGVCSE